MKINKEKNMEFKKMFEKGNVVSLNKTNLLDLLERNFRKEDFIYYIIDKTYSSQVIAVISECLEDTIFLKFPDIDDVMNHSFLKTEIEKLLEV